MRTLTETAVATCSGKSWRRNVEVAFCVQFSTVIIGQVTRMAVCKGILTCVSLNVSGLKSTAAHTADFIEFIDNLTYSILPTPRVVAKDLRFEDKD